MITDYEIPETFMEADLNSFSLALPVAIQHLQQNYPGLRVEKPRVYTDKKDHGCLFVVSDVSNGGRTLATACAKLLRRSGASPRNRWVFESIKLMTHDDRPVSKEEAKGAAAKIWTHASMAGRPLDTALAQKIADLILEIHGEQEEEEKPATKPRAKKARKS